STSPLDVSTLSLHDALPICVAMTEAHGAEFFGKAPPDLSVIARVRGPDWISAYLHSFYLDETRPVGWNNTVFPNASMPNVLWERSEEHTSELQSRENLVCRL